MRSLEVALRGEVIDIQKVGELGRQVGAHEADMTWAQAQAMLEVRGSMTESQTTALLAIREKYTGGRYEALPEDSFSRGRQLFAQCVLCHSEASQGAIGPNLKGLIGRSVASDKSFGNYSIALKKYAQENGEWSEALLDEFLASPRDSVPGTYMGFDGLRNSQDRKAIIVFLKDRE